MSAKPASRLRLCALVLLGVAIVLVSACGDRGAGSAIVIAKIDGAKISLRQFNTALAHEKGITPDNISQTKLYVLNELVNQQVAVNLAVLKKLDQKTEVLSAIEASRNQILAQAALDQILADLPKVGEDDAKRYFTGNPALFGERRIFTLQEIEIPKSAVNLDQIRSLVAEAKGIDEIVTRLKYKGVEFTNSIRMRPAEQIAWDVLPKLQAFKEGQIGLLEGDSAYKVARLVAWKSEPISFTKALPGILELLASRRATDAIRQATIGMRSKASIEYFGEFAGDDATLVAKIGINLNKTASGSTPSEIKTKIDANIVEQGIKGL